MTLVLENIPAIQNTVLHPEVSENFGLFNTMDMINTMEAIGYQVTQAHQTRARNADMMPYKKHLVRLRHVDSKPILGELHSEIVLINSHEGNTSFKMMLGFFRMICANGLIVSEGINEQIRIRHNIKNIDQVFESVEKITAKNERMTDAVAKMQTVQLATADQQEFAQRAWDIKHNDNPNKIETRQLLMARRSQDEGNDVWKVFNRIQENLMMGGQRGVNANGRRIQTRAVKNINKTVDINQKLWELAEQYVA